MPPAFTSIMLAFRNLSRRALTSGAFPIRQAPAIPFSAQRFFSVRPRLLDQPENSDPQAVRRGGPAINPPVAEAGKPSIPKPKPGAGWLPRAPKPEYEMTFTCTPCGTRSTHRISKQGYQYGSVLITCPECRNRHIISDHLNIFGDRNITIEDLMRERGQLVKKGTLSEDGDVEFWEDGTQTPRKREEPVAKGENRETASDA
ncbi:DNL zinc finger-domain-containing protein [Tricladium varicosporioides]|nr:DNL zinc finger-domain-containing protein [Hymenoscyphus varicosporioides]